MTTTTEFLHRPCPLCGADDARIEVQSPRRAETLDVDALRPFWAGLFKEKCFFSYHRCAACGLLYAPVFFDGEQLGQLYSNMAPNMALVTDAAIAATQRGYFARVAASVPLAGDYLEIGPDVGHIVAAAARAGDFGHFWLFEPNRAVHAALRAAAGGRPATICAAMDDLSAVPDGSVGLAVMIHVLDHLLDPRATLAALRAKLRPGGALLVVTHDESSLLRRLMGVRWPPFCLQHPELYRPETMRLMLAQAGFAEVTVERSRNVFPLDFLARQAAWAAGIRLARVPLPAWPIGLKLGNMLTIARAPGETKVATAAPAHAALETAE